MVRSRSFSRPVTELGEMQEAVATHAARACEKLRAEGLAARAVQVFFHTGHAEAKGPHRSVAVAAELARATNRTPEVLAACRRLVAEAWRGDDGGPSGKPYPYRKAGVVVLDVTRARPEQGHLFLGTDGDGATDALLAAVDALNRRFGRRSVTFASEGVGPRGDGDGAGVGDAAGAAEPGVHDAVGGAPRVLRAVTQQAPTAEVYPSRCFRWFFWSASWAGLVGFFAMLRSSLGEYFG